MAIVEHFPFEKVVIIEDFNKKLIDLGVYYKKFYTAAMLFDIFGIKKYKEYLNTRLLYDFLLWYCSPLFCSTDKITPKLFLAIGKECIHHQIESWYFDGKEENGIKALLHIAYHLSPIFWKAVKKITYPSCSMPAQNYSFSERFCERISQLLSL